MKRCTDCHRPLTVARARSYARCQSCHGKRNRHKYVPNAETIQEPRNAREEAEATRLLAERRKEVWQAR